MTEFKIGDRVVCKVGGKYRITKKGHGYGVVEKIWRGLAYIKWFPYIRTEDYGGTFAVDIEDFELMESDNKFMGSDYYS